MGSTVCQAVVSDPDLELVAAVDPSHSGIDVRQVTGAPVDRLQVAPDPSGFTDALVEVAVDFTEAAAAMDNMRWCAEHNVHAVVGTSGLRESD
ncbi:MAG: 4-hydroxy-tetrahydrodipicolinate reductase, partial [Actinomycetota bacterium]|nr:4-hydroxy-tetrahydrodipicolinate reductase [Actinomycetota bacterium]